ncbi:hypothetical protein TNCV_3438031 [Trichonephila clavipes]|nr:hypothetical protein TNCV_3438031 [Trichonephila clavipes]
MGQYDDDESTLLMCVHHDAAKHGCDYLGAVNRTWIHLKNHLAIRGSKFVVDHTIEDAPVRHAAPGGSSSLSLQAENPCCCKLRRTVRADTCCLENDPNSCLGAHDVAALSMKAMRYKIITRK